jgi:hypothetical protein
VSILGTILETTFEIENRTKMYWVFKGFYNES